MQKKISMKFSKPSLEFQKPKTKKSNIVLIRSTSFYLRIYAIFKIEKNNRFFFRIKKKVIFNPQFSEILVN